MTPVLTMPPPRRPRIAGVKDLISRICPRVRGRSLPTVFFVFALCIFSVVVVVERNMTAMIPRDILPSPYGSYRMINWTFSKNKTKNLVNHSTAMSDLQMTSIMPNNPSRYFTDQTSQSGQAVTERNSSTVDPVEGVTEKNSSTVEPVEAVTERNSSTVDPVEKYSSIVEAVTERNISTVDPVECVIEKNSSTVDPEEAVTVDLRRDVTERNSSTVDPVEAVTERNSSTVDQGQAVTERKSSTVDPGDYRMNPKTTSNSSLTVHINKSYSPPQDTDSSTTFQIDTGNLEKTAMNKTFITIQQPFTTWPVQQSIFSTIQKILGSTRYNLPLYPDKFQCSEEFKVHHLMTSSTSGRTGNELFELASLLATANDTCYTAFLPSSKINLDSIFDIRNIERHDINTSQFGAISEEAWGFYEGPISNNVNPNQNWTITGVRQSFRYFHHKRQLVRSSFIFKDKIKEDVASFFSKNFLHNKTKVGIHVRRGDFLNEDKMKHGYTSSSVQFILKAITYFNETLRNKDLAFIFVSDTIQWCKDNINLTNAYFSPMEDIGKDLFILTQCDHNVVTSGTFGWMGAWLNETGTVVYDRSFPKEKSELWYGHLKEHYYPDWWIGL